MTQHQTIADYVKSQLTFNLEIFPTRFDVLSHMFATLGSGISFKDGYIQSELPSVTAMSADEIKHAYIDYHGGMRSLQTVSRMQQRKNRLVGSEYFMAEPRNVVRSIKFEERYYALPVFVNVYEWSSDERYQPFTKFKECKCPDLHEQLNYFLSVIDTTDVDTTSPLKYYSHIRGADRTVPPHLTNTVSDEYEHAVASLLEWQTRTAEVRDYFGIQYS